MIYLIILIIWFILYVGIMILKGLISLFLIVINKSIENKEDKASKKDIPVIEI